MFLLRGFLAAGLGLLVTAALTAAPPRAQGRASSHTIRGTIVKVHHNRKHRGSGWIAIRRAHHHHRRRSTTAAAAVGRSHSRRGSGIVRVSFDRSTRFERLNRGRNGAAGAHRVSIHSVRTGESARVVLGTRGHHAREVDILSGASSRSARRGVNGARYAYRRSTLIGSRVLARHGRPQHYRTARRSVRRFVAIRPVRHTLVEGRTAHRRHHHHGSPALTSAMKRQINQTVRRDVKKDLQAMHKHQVKAHGTTTKHAVSKPTKHTHSSGHAKPPARRKR